MPPADDDEKYTIEYIRCAEAVVVRHGRRARMDFYYCAQWSGYPRCDEFYPVSNYDEDDVREFWKHLDDRTWPKDGWFKSGWRVFMNQPYRDAKILEDVERRELALTERLVNLAATCPESAIAQRPSRDEFLPDALEAEMRERTDFSLRGDYVSELEEWKFIPTPSCKTKARAPFPASYIRPSHEYLEHDYRVTILKQDAEESTDQEDNIVYDVFGGDDGFLPPAVTSLVYAEDGWPMQLQRIPFCESLSLQQTLFATFGKDLVRKFTRWWRREDNRNHCYVCWVPVEELGDKAFATQCMHIYCQPCLRNAWDTAKEFEPRCCPMCKTVLTHCPFPAHALFDPCRVHRHKKPSNGTAAGSSHEEAVIRNKKSTGNAYADQGGPPTGPKKKPRRRGGKVRREELARKAKAKLPK
ncbi:hypothetical protein EXIGLDRAFT_766270 [Exidia glandulosa HHB12029]|uniref:RING-type domain-containing protein n=1 Tax=Exidia glandulosa HHB12029 TaxID=1314781 RepID=A0A165JUP2_EXIGL|nr:hypothetical protein EXIGLDRAFT_766270 [Exidia glandulosa HHB12029]